MQLLHMGLCILMSRWNYLIRCIPYKGNLLCPSKEVIRIKLLHNLTGHAQCTFNAVELDLLSLPPRFSGLDIVNTSLPSTLFQLV